MKANMFVLQETTLVYCCKEVMSQKRIQQINSKEARPCEYNSISSLLDTRL